MLIFILRQNFPPESCSWKFDYAVIFGGGHAYEILEDDTKSLKQKMVLFR